MKPATIHGYADRLSVAPGEPIEFKVSTDTQGSYRADVVRLIHGDTNPAGPGFKERVVDSPANGEYDGRQQAIRSGSHVAVVDPAGHLALRGAISMHVFAQPTTPEAGVQRLLGRMAAIGGAGYALDISDGRLRLTVGDGSRTAQVESDVTLCAQCWYSLGATYDPATGEATIYQAPVRNSYNSLLSPMIALPAPTIVRGSAAVAPADADVAFTIAADPSAGSHFNGKLDSPKVWRRALGDGELEALSDGATPPGAGLVAHWDFAEGIGPRGVPTDHVRDVAGLDLFGICVNQPARGMTGWNWDCSEECYRHAPGQYGAIHFHDDDLDDCGWETDVALDDPGRHAQRRLRAARPPGRGRGLHSVLRAPAARHRDRPDRVPRADGQLPRLRERPHRARRAVAQAILGHTSVLSEQDFYLYGNLELGLLDVRLAHRRERRVLSRRRAGRS